MYAVLTLVRLCYSACGEESLTPAHHSLRRIAIPMIPRATPIIHVQRAPRFPSVHTRVRVRVRVRVRKALSYAGRIAMTGMNLHKYRWFVSHMAIIVSHFRSTTANIQGRLSPSLSLNATSPITWRSPLQVRFLNFIFAPLRLWTQVNEFTPDARIVAHRALQIHVSHRYRGLVEKLEIWNRFQLFPSRGGRLISRQRWKRSGDGDRIMSAPRWRYGNVTRRGATPPTGRVHKLPSAVTRRVAWLQRLRSGRMRMAGTSPYHAEIYLVWAQ